MRAEALIHERHQLAAGSFVEIKIWRVPHPVRGSAHKLKYALAYIVAGVCVLRYDNEAGKSDHRHLGDTEDDYVFIDTTKWLADFWRDLDQWGTR